MNQTDGNEKSRKAIILIVIALLVLAMGILASKKTNFSSSSNTSNTIQKNENVENKIEDENYNNINEDEEMLVEYGITLNEYKMVDTKVIDNALEYSKLGNIESNFNGNNLLLNESFKFAFAFVFGYEVNRSLYSECANGVGNFCIKISDFEEFYSKIYGINYKFSGIPNELSSFLANDDYIVGTLYSGYSYNNNFNYPDPFGDLEPVIVKDYNDNQIGIMQYSSDKLDSGKYVVSAIYLNGGAQAY